MTTSKKAASKAPRRRARKPTADPPEIVEVGGWVVSVFGPFGSRVLVDLPVGVAQALFGDSPLGECGPHNVVDAVRRDLEQLPESLSGSALAATAVALAYELEHPHNSATSKSMCARALTDALAQLRELAPPPEESDDVDDLAAARNRRRAAARVADAADLPHT